MADAATAGSTNYVEAGAPMEAPPDHDEEPINPHTTVVLLAVCSAFELVAASLVCGETQCTGVTAYAVAVGVVSLALLAPVALVLFAEPLAPRRLPDGLPHLSLLLLMWWLPACFLLTFIEPFQGLCNGYFATLGATASAVQLARVHVQGIEAGLVDALEQVRSASPDRAALLALAFSSTAVWVQAAITLGRAPMDHPGAMAWAIIIGVVSSVMCAFYLLLSNFAIHRFGFAALMACWWLQGIAVSFVPSGFTGTINGYISCWVSVLIAAYFLRTSRSPRDLEPVPTAPPEEGLGGPTTEYMSQEDATDGFSATLGKLGGSTWATPGFGSAVAPPTTREPPSAENSTFRQPPHDDL